MQYDVVVGAQSRFLNSAVHQIGLLVLIHTFSSGMRWFEVETKPSKEDSCSAVAIIRKTKYSDGKKTDALRFHRSPVVESIVESMPTGSRPHVGPRTL